MDCSQRTRIHASSNAACSILFHQEAVFLEYPISPVFSQSMSNTVGLKQNGTCFIIIVADGNVARFPFEPAARSNAASPHAFPTHNVKIGGFTYL